MRTDEELGGPWSDSLPAEPPVVHRNLTVTVGARNLTTLTHDHLVYWLGRLAYARGGPFMTVARAENPGPFIQTYRNSDTDYPVEVHFGPEEAEHLAATARDVGEVGQLIWAWLENDWPRIEAVAWERRRLR